MLCWNLGRMVCLSIGGSYLRVLTEHCAAISTLLQPPIVRTGHQAHTSVPASSVHKPPTARDIPPVALTNIKKVDASEFKPYLAQVGALYEQLQRVKESEEEGRSREGSKSDETLDLHDESRLKAGGNRPQTSRKSSVSSIGSLNSIDSHSKRRGSAQHRRVAHGPTPLSTIPSVYFDEDFHLENPRTFDVVSERSEVVPPNDIPDSDKTSANGTAAVPRKALATNAILQEKLSWYMDTIEVHLINSISTASTTFFTALGSLRELHSEAGESVERIKALRKDLAKLDEELVSKGLELGQMRRKRENLQQLGDSILQLKYVVEGVARCEELVDQGDVEAALSEIDSLEKVMAGERVPGEDHPLSGIQVRDLRAATALQGVAADLDTLRFRIGRAYEIKLQELLIRDLRKHVESVSTSEVLQRWGGAAMRARGGHVKEPSVFPSYMSDTKELRAALLPNIVGLHSANHIAKAIGAYREAVLREIKTVVRRPLPSANDDDNDSMMSASTAGGGRSRSSQERSAILARNLRALDAEDSEELLAKIYVGVSETLRRMTTQTKVLLDIGSEIGNPQAASGVKSPSVRSPSADIASPVWKQNPSAFEIQEELHKALDLSNLLGQAVDTGQDKIVRILRVRSEQSVSLELSQFLRYFTLNLFFANECESISGRGGAALKTLVNSQIKDFVRAHGDREIQILAQGMGSDNWSAKDFGDKENVILQDILQASTQDPASWGKPSRIWLLASADEQANGEAPPAESNGVAKEKARGATIDSETFLLPNSALLCLTGISHYLRLMGGIPSMTADTATSLIAYLQMFNSRCTQLILGAGATRSAGLKNITTKHLALASQALAFLATLIPHIREFVRRHAGVGPNAAGLMGEFDKVRRLLQEHQDSIFQKLVDIMSSRAMAHCKSMRAVDWSVPVEGPHAYAETLAKETSTLHRVLIKHLPERSIQLIMMPVFSSYKEQLGKAFQAADPQTQAGRDRLDFSPTTHHLMSSTNQTLLLLGFFL